MAIQGSYSFYGAVLPAAIAVADSITVQSDNQMVVRAYVYADADQRAANTSLVLEARTTSYDPSGASVWAQAQAYLLGLPEFNGWTPIP
jgi:hypothetical protein